MGVTAPASQRDGWERLWGRPRDHWFQRPSFRAAVLGSLEGTQLGSAQVLDAGCGSGQYIDDLRRAGVGRIVGADLAFAALEQSETRLVCQASLTGLPFASSVFDVICCILALEHVEDDTAVLLELRRVARRGGRMLAVVPRRRSAAGIYLRWVEPWRKRLASGRTVLDDIPFHRTYGVGELEGRAEQVGWRLVRRREASILEHVGPRPARWLLRQLGERTPWARWFGDELIVVFEAEG
jgi:SAM-dependent methyltransferase